VKNEKGATIHLKQEDIPGSAETPNGRSPQEGKSAKLPVAEPVTNLQKFPDFIAEIALPFKKRPKSSRGKKIRSLR
jgi:hypothetical protein